MNCCITDLRNKEVINTKNGCRLGCVSDVEICCETGNLTAIIIWGKYRFPIISGRDDDIRIPWCDIKVIGEETILVCIDEKDCSSNSKKSTKKNFDFIFK